MLVSDHQLNFAALSFRSRISWRILRRRGCLWTPLCDMHSRTNNFGNRSAGFPVFLGHVTNYFRSSRRCSERQLGLVDWVGFVHSFVRRRNTREDTKLWFTDAVWQWSLLFRFRQTGWLLQPGRVSRSAILTYLFYITCPTVSGPRWNQIASNWRRSRNANLIYQLINQSIDHYFFMRPKVDQRAGQLSLPHVTKTESNRTKT